MRVTGRAPAGEARRSLDVASQNPALIGRARECAQLADLISAVRNGDSRALVIEGDVGVGKSALLGFLTRSAVGCLVVEVAGVESEMELAYAGLHQLCGPLLDGLERIPGPQRAALRTALGLTSGEIPDRFLVGLSVLSLLSEAARHRPVMCAIDDVQWLDRASVQTIAFVARRLGAEAVGVVLSQRFADSDPDLGRLPNLVIGGLSDADARILLGTVVTGPLDERVRDRIVAETRGNPLAILELTRGLTPEQVAGGFGLSGVGAVTGQIEESFRRRLVALPSATRRLLVVAAAEPGQDAALIWRAAARLGIGPEDAEPASVHGLVDFGGQVRFSHPLARSTAYRSAQSDERRAAHQALADATDPVADPERRAWHRAQAAPGLDEEVAIELELSAGLAEARGGLAATAAFLERAAELTPDPVRRGRRAVEAAQAKFRAGAPDRALRLLAMAGASPADEMTRARADLVHAHISSRLEPGQGAPLLAAAKGLESLDPELARETYRDAFYAAHVAGRLGRSGGIREVAAAVRASGPTLSWVNAFDPIVAGLATVVVDGYIAGAPMLQDAVGAFRATDVSTEVGFSWLPLACRVAIDLWDDDSVRDLSTRVITLARARGALSVLPTALSLGVGYQVYVGDMSAATELAEECEAIGEATAISKPPYGRLAVAAWRGLERRVVAIIDEATPEAIARGEGQWLTATGWCSAVLNNALGRYDRALVAAESGTECPEELGVANWTLVELVEAAARSGLPERASAAMGRLSEIAAGCGTDWAVGAEARSLALLAEGEVAEQKYREAIERLDRTRLRTELARAHLVYGEWLRRENRRIDARPHLRVAHDAFSDIGADAFAARAQRELLATGETVRKRGPGTDTELTDQESQIVRLAARGQTNPEIATQLFISPRTVEWHLRKVFGKLGISSRKELRDVVGENGALKFLDATSPRT